VTTTVTVGERLDKIWGSPPGLATWFGTIDHKRLSMRYIYTALIFFVAGGLEALVMRSQLAHSNLRVVSPEAYNQLFTMHGITMMFLFAPPILSGFGFYIVPLMIGARDVAFPRLNALGYYAFAASGVFLYTSFLVGRAPDAGWFNYTPLAGGAFNTGVNIDFYTLGLLFAGVSLTAGALNIIVTIFKLRAPGMSVNRIPIFVWGELAMALSVVFALPALTAANIMLTLDRKWGFNFFNTAKGGDQLLWQHLFWIFGHPLVYLIILPAFGMVSAIIPTSVKRPMIGYTYIVLAEMATGLLGFGVWVHHMFATGLPEISLSYISLVSFMITIPSGVQFFAWLATIVAGKPVLRTSFLFVSGFIVVFVIGGFSGVMFASVPFDQSTTDSYFVVAHIHYVLVGGMVFPIFAALYHWGPKMTGRLMSERAGKWSFWLMFVGFNGAFFPQHITGLMGQPRRTYTYPPGLGWDVWNLISTIGAFLFAAGALVTFVNWFWARRWGATAGNDPWQGETLEWATTSPPPHYNFETIPRIRSKEPTWDHPQLRDGAQPPSDGGRPLDAGHFQLSTSMLDATPEAALHLPEDSLWPFGLTLALTAFFYGLLLGSVIVTIAGAAACLVGTAGWLWPRGESPGT
jgi:cytochrome c oxidase subunit 1/cytochrome c oxidase subunit I+III